MKKILLLILVSSCTIIIPPGFTTSDLYQLNKEKLSSNYNVQFIEITAQELLESKPREILLFADWCSHSHLYIRDLTPEQKIGVKFVSSNYNLDYLNRKFALDTIYLLSNSHYGSVQNDKIDQFATELLKQDNEIIAVPQRFILKDSVYKRIPLYSNIR